MASEYLKWKYRDVQPNPPLEMTPEQKRANWWFYHKWHVLLGLGGVALGIYLGARALGIGQIKPDYQVAYVGSTAIPEETVTALETALAGLGNDCNGDDKVVVCVNQYVMGDGSDAGAAYTYAGSIKLMADLDACDSYFFLLEDPVTFQKNHQVLSGLDGSLSEEPAQEQDGYYLSWSQCPVLQGLSLGEFTEIVLGQEIQGDSQEQLAPLYVARRGFWTERTCAYLPECDALWNVITRGSDQ